METRSYWLSFCGDGPGDQLLGVSVVDVTQEDADRALVAFPWTTDAWFVAAIQKAHDTGCNPGGQVLGSQVQDCPAPRHVLMNRAEAERINEMAGPVH